MTLQRKKIVLNKLEEPIKRSIEIIARTAHNSSIDLFVVGSFLRNHILKNHIFNIEIIYYSQDVEWVMVVLAKKLKLEPQVVRRNKEVQFILPDVSKAYPKDRNFLEINLKMARTKKLELKKDTFSPKRHMVKEYLLKRNFTFDALALSLGKNSYLEIIDPINAENDVRKREISFVNSTLAKKDPASIFRAIRYEVSHGFHLSKDIEKDIYGTFNLKLLSKNQKISLRDELIRILSEESASLIIKKILKLHLLRFVSTGIRYHDDMDRVLRGLDRDLEWFKTSNPGKRDLDPWVMRSCILFQSLGFKKTVDVCDKLLFNRGDRKRILTFNSEWKKIEEALISPANTKPSLIFKELDSLPYEVILLVFVRTKDKKCRQKIKDYFCKYSNTNLEIELKDIIDLKASLTDVKSKQIFLKVLYAKIDEEVDSYESEIKLAKKLIKELNNKQ